MYYIVSLDEQPDGFAMISTSASWEQWLKANIPHPLAQLVRARLRSNLKHILVGLELKAALIQPHHDQHGVLFAPYFQAIISEFCFGAFSVLEGLGVANWLAQEGLDGSGGPYPGREQWTNALVQAFDPEGEFGLADATERTRSVRDRLHQDRLAIREDIDWHAFSYEAGFAPAISAIRTLLRSHAELVPQTSNLP